MPISECHALLASPPDFTAPTAREAHGLAQQLLAKWPWLGSTQQDLTVYAADVAILFAGHSRDAARHVLHPMTAPEWDGDRPPAPNALRRALSAFDEARRAAVRNAQWMIDEAGRRAKAAEVEAQRLAGRQAFLERCHGRNPIDVILEEGRR